MTTHPHTTVKCETKRERKTNILEMQHTLMRTLKQDWLDETRFAQLKNGEK